MPKIFRELLPQIEPETVDHLYSVRMYTRDDVPLCTQDGIPLKPIYEPWPDRPDTEPPFAEALDAFEAALIAQEKENAN